MEEEIFKTIIMIVIVILVLAFTLIPLFSSLR